MPRGNDKRAASSSNAPKRKKETTKDFFGNKKTSGFTFNAAPVEMKKKRGGEELPSSSQKKRNFLSRLHDDNLSDLSDDFAPNTQKEIASKKKRDQKLESKADPSLKVQKLKFSKGALGLFAISELHENFAIVNFTRNKKGYLPLPEGINKKKLKVGQLISAVVESEGTAQYNKNTSGNLNRKLQLQLDLGQLNRSLTIENLLPRMILQAKVGTKEAKGYFLDLKMKDKSKAFGVYPGEDLEEGDLVFVRVVSANPSNKIVKCEIINESEQVFAEEKDALGYNKEVNFQQVKPGFLVNAKVVQSLENGIKVSFLSGIEGTIFVDHCEKALKSYKVGDKLVARVISSDIITKRITLSQKEHLVKFQQANFTNLQNGQIVERSVVSKILYGNSYLVYIGNGITGFLHKTQAQEEEKDAKKKKKQMEDDEDEEGNKGSKKNEELKQDQELGKIRIKEFNYFDGLPILSNKIDVLDSQALEYQSLQIGAEVKGKITQVSENHVEISLSDYVKGRLYLEHMAEVPIKTIPPKLQKIGKSVRVRVFQVDQNLKRVEFTKKDSLLKESAYVPQNVQSIKKGQKIYGLIVSKTQHGYQIKTFGGIQGLLNFSEVTKKAQKNDLREGCFIKSYVLFKKNGKLALTTDKAKVGAEADEEMKDVSKKDQKEANFEDQLPQDFKAIKKAFKKQGLLLSNPESCVGSFYQFKSLEIDTFETEDFILCKAIVEKGGSFAAVLPKSLISNNQNLIDNIIQAFQEDETKIQGYITEIIENIPIITLNLALVQALTLKQIPASVDELQETTQAWGFISKTEQKKVSIRFLNGIEVQTSKIEKDAELELLKLGQAVRIQKDIKSGQWSLLNQHLYQKQESQKNYYSDRAILGKAAYHDWRLSLRKAEKETGLQVGLVAPFFVKVAKEQYVLVGRDYESQIVSGFVTDDHCKKECQKHKLGETLNCKVLDLDPEKSIADLSQTLSSFTQPITNQVIKQSAKYPQNENETAIVELNKESYLLVSLKKNRSMMAYIDLQNSNGTPASKFYKEIQTGEEIQVKIVGKTQNEETILVAVPAFSAEALTQGNQVQVSNEIQKGTIVTGKITSIKSPFAYLRLNQSNLVVGRLHQTEVSHFDQLFVGERAKCKVLDVQEKKEGKKQMMYLELTMRKEHMEAAVLDTKQLGVQRDQLVKGQQYEGMIASVNPSRSHPVQISFSTQLTGFVPFHLCVKDIENFKDNLKSEFKIGSRHQFTYIGQEKNEMQIFGLSEEKEVKSGELYLARVVKLLAGQGATVQLTPKTYGMLDISEISDDLQPCILNTLQDKGVFKVRVLQEQKKDKSKWNVSTRASILDSDLYQHISPKGKSVNFKKAFKTMEEQGNLRNRILKYGAKSLQVNQLCVGYVSNISKAGCFIKIGHNTVGRAALQELSDEPDFDYLQRLPIGMPVLGRIIKIEEAQNDEEAPPRLSLSLRESIVKYGLQEGKSSQKLKEGDVVSALVLAKAADASFVQVIGAIQKVKVKEMDASVEVKDLVKVKVTKVEGWKTKGSFVEKLASDSEFPQEKFVGNLWSSIEEIQLEQSAASRKRKDSKAMEIDQSLLLGQQAARDQTAQQIQDLNALQEMDDDSGSMVSVHGDDSSEDERDMRRIIQQSKAYEDSDEEGEMDQEEDSADDDEEEGDMEMEEMEEEQDDSEEEKLPEKKGLKKRIQEERKIQEVEKQLGKEGEQPQSLDDFERLLVQNPDQSYVWIQYIAYMLENLDVKAARRVAERAVKSVSISSDQEKLNLWIAFLNLENSFGTQDTLQKVVQRALEVNDRKKVYLQLINIYMSSKKYDLIEDILKLLSKKYNFDTDIWRKYMQVLFELANLKEQGEPLLKNVKLTVQKDLLSKCLQVLPKKEHVSMISKFGQLEFKHGRPENGRTMFEGIISSYPKRMDIWSVYLNLEASSGNKQQARTLFEKCLARDEVMKKAHNAKQVFKLYAEFELKNKNQKAVEKIKQRAEEYLEKHYGQDEDQEMSD